MADEFEKLSEITGQLSESDSSIVSSLHEMSKEPINYFNIILESLKIAIPAIVFYLSIHIQTALNFIFLGIVYDSEDMIDGIGVATIYINTVALSIVVGLLSAFDTLGSNAYAEKQYRLFCTYYYRSIVICFIYIVPLSIFNYFFAGSVMSTLLTDPLVIQYCSTYINVSIWFVFWDILLQANLRYLNIIGQSHINLILVIFCTLLHVLWCKLLIVDLNLGVHGAGLAIFITQGLHAILSTVYIFGIQPEPEATFFPDSACVHELYSYFNYAWKSLFTYCVDNWTYQILLIFAAMQSKEQYSAHIIAANIYLLVFQTLKGFGLSTNNLVGKYIIIASVEDNKRLFTLFFWLTFICVSVMNLQLFIFKEQYMSLYTSNEEIIYWGEQILQLCCLMTFFSIVWWHLNYTMRGLGMFDEIYKTNIKYYMIVQIVCLYVFTVHFEWGILGVWYSNITSFFVGMCALIQLFNTVKVAKCKRELMKKLFNDSKSLHKFMLKNGLMTRKDVEDGGRFYR